MKKRTVISQTPFCEVVFNTHDTKVVYLEPNNYLNTYGYCTNSLKVLCFNKIVLIIYSADIILQGFYGVWRQVYEASC